MQDGLFFRVLRRFNMVLCTLIALGLIVLAGLAGWQSYKSGRIVQALSSGSMYGEVKGKIEYKYDVVLAPFETQVSEYRPTSYDIFVLNRTPGGTPAYWQPSEVANIMEIDQKANTAHWLFKGADRTITFRSGVRKGELAQNALTDDRPIIGLVLWVVEKDGNKDGAFGYQDPIAVYIWRVGEQNATKLLDADDGLSTGQISADRFGIVYVKGGKRISAIYSVPDFKLVSEKVLPDPLK